MFINSLYDRRIPAVCTVWPLLELLSACVDIMHVLHEYALPDSQPEVSQKFLNAILPLRLSTWSSPPSSPTVSSWLWSSTFLGRIRPPCLRDWWDTHTWEHLHNICRKDTHLHEHFIPVKVWFCDSCFALTGEDRALFHRDVLLRGGYKDHRPGLCVP